METLLLLALFTLVSILLYWIWKRIRPRKLKLGVSVESKEHLREVHGFYDFDELTTFIGDRIREDEFKTAKKNK